MDELLIKYLLGESSETEEVSVQQWLASSEENRRYFDQLKQVWEAAQQLKTTIPVDVDQAWAVMKQRIDTVEQTSQTVTLRQPKLSFARIAAAAILILGLGIFFYVNNRPTVLFADNNVLVDTLPDQSVITLNKHARIRYAKSFDKKERKLQLEGEAFFDVTANKEKPFLIEANEVTVKVVGTSFNVKTNASYTEVIVETGIVQVLANGQSVAVHPGQKIVVSKNNNELKVQENKGLLYNYYRSQELICNNTPLVQLVDALNQAYEVNIELAHPQLAQKRITTRFKLGELDDILAVIATTLNVQVVHKGDKIVLQ